MLSGDNPAMKPALPHCIYSDYHLLVDIINSFTPLIKEPGSHQLWPVLSSTTQPNGTSCVPTAQEKPQSHFAVRKFWNLPKFQAAIDPSLWQQRFQTVLMAVGKDREGGQSTTRPRRKERLDRLDGNLPEALLRNRRNSCP